MALGPYFVCVFKHYLASLHQKGSQTNIRYYKATYTSQNCSSGNVYATLLKVVFMLK